MNIFNRLLQNFSIQFDSEKHVYRIQQGTAEGTSVWLEHRLLSAPVASSLTFEYLSVCPNMSRMNLLLDTNIREQMRQTLPQ